MNKRQKKKFRKKAYFKKYRLYTIARFMYNDNTGETDMVVAYIHNSDNTKIVKATLCRGITPVSCSYGNNNERVIGEGTSFPLKFVSN